MVSKMPGQKFASPDVVKALPAGVIIEALTLKLIAEKTIDVHLIMGIQFSDSDESYALEFRKGMFQCQKIS